MPVLSTLALVGGLASAAAASATVSGVALAGGLAASAAGTAIQFQGQQKAHAASELGIDAQQQAEAARNQAMELDATRKRREMVRQAVVARSQSLAQATGQGAQFSSSLAGAQAGITGQTNYNMLGVNQNEEIGQDIFKANQNLLSARRQESSAQSQIALGSGISSLGGTIASGVSSINRLQGFAPKSGG